MEFFARFVWIGGEIWEQIPKQLYKTNRLDLLFDHKQQNQSGSEQYRSDDGPDQPQEPRGRSATPDAHVIVRYSGGTRVGGQVGVSQVGTFGDFFGADFAHFQRHWIGERAGRIQVL